VLYDLLTNNRYGLGDVFTTAKLTLGKWDLYNLAKYCDGNNARAGANYIPYSEQIDQWGASEVTITANAAVAPDGTLTADKIVPTVVNNLHIIADSTNVDNSGTGPRTFSVYAKPAGYNRIGMRVWDGAAYQIKATFDVALGTIVDNTGGTAGIEAVGNGWYRCWVSGTSAAGNWGSVTGWDIDILNNTSVVQTAYAGNAVSGVYLWGAQVTKSLDKGFYVKTVATVVVTSNDYTATGSHGVPDGSGGFEPRFTFNATLRDKMSAYEAIAAILGMFRSAMIFANGQLRFLQDSPQTPAKVFTPANVVGGLFNYTGTALRARHTAVRVSWSNPAMDYLLDDVLVEDPEGIERYGYNLKEETAFGCTSFGQAIRHARNILETEKLETDTVQFKIGHGEADIMPGQVFKVEDPSMTQAEWGGRLIPTQYGPEMVTNCSFDTGIGSWVAGNGAALSFNAGKLRVTNGNFGYAYQQITGLVIGHTYRIRGTIPATSGINTFFYVGYFAGNAGHVVLNPNPGDKVNTTFVADVNTVYISIGVGDGVAGHWIEIDDVSLQDVLVAKTSMSQAVLDRPVTLETGQVYTITMVMPDGTLADRVVTNGIGATSTITFATNLPAEPVDNALWVISSNVRTSREFRLIVIAEDEAATYKIMGTEYQEGKFEKIDFNTDRPVSPFSDLPSASVVNPPTNVALTFLTIEDGAGAHGVLDLSWSPSTDHYLRGYRVTYQQGSDPWVIVPEQHETTFRLMDPKKAVIRFLVKAVNTWGRGSAVQAKDADLTAAAGAGNSAVAPISNLYVMGSASTTWTGKDLPLQWNAQALWGLATSGTGEGLDPNFKYFRVKLLNATTNAVLSTYFTRRNRFTIPYQDMVAGGLDRSYKISLEYGASDGSYSTPVISTFTNPAPSLPTGTATAKADQLTITFDPPTDPDFEGMIVWMSTTNGFTPGSGNRVWKARGNPVIPVLPNTTYYFRYSPYDAFGETSIPLSTQQSITTPQPGTDTTVSTKLAGIEANADVTRVVSGPASINVPYDYTGTTIEATFDAQYKLIDYLGVVTTGVTANYTVLDGTFNGFNSGSGAQSMSVSAGAATLPITTLTTASATIRVDMIKNSITRSETVVLTMAKADQPPSGGGGGGYPQSQTAGFTTLVSPWTSFIAIMGRIQITMPTGKTSARIVVSLSPKWAPKTQTSVGPWNLEFKVQRNTGTTGTPVWTDIGATQNSNPDPQIETDPETGFVFSSGGTMSYTFDDTGRTAGTIYEYQVVARISSGATTSNTGGIAFTGSVALSAP
jgi:hypothetical protein